MLHKLIHLKDVNNHIILKQTTHLPQKWIKIPEGHTNFIVPASTGRMATSRVLKKSSWNVLKTTMNHCDFVKVCFRSVIYVFYNEIRVKTGLTKPVINLGQMNKFWKIFPRHTCLPSPLFCSFCYLKYTNSVHLHFLETNDTTPQGCAEGWLVGMEVCHVGPGPGWHQSDNVAKPVIPLYTLQGYLMTGTAEFPAYTTPN